MIAEVNCTYEEALSAFRAGLEELQKGVTDTNREEARLKATRDSGPTADS